MIANLVAVVLLILLSCFSGCVAPGQGGSPAGQVSASDAFALGRRIDTSGDGHISSAEVKQAGSDYSLWIQAGLFVLGALGLGKAASAGKAADLAQSHVDDLYDATHVPLGSVPPVGKQS